MYFIRSMIATLILAAIAFGVWAYSGTYDIGADTPHWWVTKKVINVVRERSIETRAQRIVDVPNLNDAALIKLGAQHYHEMCTGCHLAPGMQDSELRTGLYPKPPNLTKFAPDPAEAFWVIKHGVKMTAMPAWGKTHDDHKIWAMVAYLEHQPTMTAAQYRSLTAGADDDDDDAPHHHDQATPASAASAHVTVEAVPPTQASGSH